MTDQEMIAEFSHLYGLEAQLLHTSQILAEKGLQELKDRKMRQICRNVFMQLE